jgi:hypothetical protein
MSSYTLVPESPTTSLISGGLSANAAITLARLVCDTTIGTDDLVSINSQNNFVLDLIAAVGPVVAFNAICRQLLKINATVSLPYSGTAYAPISGEAYSNYLTTYVMRDTALLAATSFPATFTFLPEQFQTLAAFANVGVSLVDILQVADYHILMIYLTGLTATNVSSLVYTNLANPYSSTYSFSKYLATSNISSAKYLYAISSLAQNGNVAFNGTSPEIIVAGALKDPEYTDNDDKIYGLIASISILVDTQNLIRTKYDYLTKPVQYSLSGNILTRNANATTSNFSISRMAGFSTLTGTKNIYYYRTVDLTNGNQLTNPVDTTGLLYTPSQKQLVTVAALTTQPAQSIYDTLSLSSNNTTAVDSTTAQQEITTLKSYGKTLTEIRSITDSNNYSIPAFNNPDNFLAAGFSKSAISSAFSGLVGSNYDFAVLINVCKYVSDSTIATTRMKVSVNTATYNFDTIDTTSISASSIVSKLKTIILASNDAVYNFSSVSSNTAKDLLAHVKACFNDFTPTTAINSGNAELAVLRFLHTSASANASYAADTTSKYTAFTASYDLPNMYAFSKLSLVLSSSSSNTTRPSDFLKSDEFGRYSAATALSSTATLALVVDSITTTYSKGPIASSSLTNSAQNGGSNSYWMKLPNGDLLQKQFYSLGFVTKTYYGSTTGIAANKYFDNGASFADVYAFMAPSTAGSTKIDGIKNQYWPKEIVFSNYSLLLTDTVSHTMKKMNPNNISNISDAALLNAYSSSNMWCTLTYLLCGPIAPTNVSTLTKSAKFDNTSYKALTNAGATAQYIKVDLATNAQAVTDAEFGGLGLPMDVALYVARNGPANGDSITISEIAKNTAFSRYARRRIFANVTEAAQQLDSETFIKLVWSPTEIATVMSSATPLNISVSDLLTLAVDSNEITSDYFVVTNQQKRLAYHTDALRKSVVAAFYPNLSADLTAQLSSLYDPDEILDFLANNNL